MSVDILVTLVHQWPLWWSKFPAALFYPRLLFSYFENRTLFSCMTENALHLFLLNKDIYLENINSMITQPHQILTVHPVMWASYQEVDDHPNSCLHLLFYYRMIHNPKYEAWGLLLKSRNRKNVWSSDVDHLFFEIYETLTAYFSLVESFVLFWLSIRTRGLCWWFLIISATLPKY